MPGPNRHTEGLIDFSDVVASTTATNGEIRANLGNASTGSGIDRSVPFWGIDGFLSRPLDSGSGGAAQYLYFCDGNQRYAIGSRDRRFYSVIEPIDIGDRMIYSPCGIRIRLDESEQAIEQTMPGGTKQYLSADLYFVGMQAGTVLQIDENTIDARKTGVAEPVALYGALQDFATELFGLVEILCVGNPAAVPTPYPGVLPALIAASVIPGPIQGAMIAAIGAAYITIRSAALVVTNPLLASSAVLRASPT